MSSISPIRPAFRRWPGHACRAVARACACNLISQCLRSLQPVPSIAPASSCPAASSLEHGQQSSVNVPGLRCARSHYLHASLLSHTSRAVHVYACMQASCNHDAYVHFHLAHLRCHPGRSHCPHGGRGGFSSGAFPPPRRDASYRDASWWHNGVVQALLSDFTSFITLVCL